MVQAPGARGVPPSDLDAVTDDDEGAARIFRALYDPPSLRLLLHVLETGQCDTDVGRLLDMTAGSATAHLDHLVQAGLLVRTQCVESTDVYRVTDAAAIERLLATVRQLSDRDRKVLTAPTAAHGPDRRRESCVHRSESADADSGKKPELVPVHSSPVGYAAGRPGTALSLSRTDEGPAA